MPDHRDLLAACLAEIEAGTSSIEECAARYPEMTGLADQLRMAMALRELPPISMPDVRKMALERRLLQVMDTRTPTRRSPLAVLRPLAMLAAILIVLSLAAFGVAHVSRSSLPGDFLYSYKRGVEQVELNFAGAKRPLVLTSIAENRLHELESVVIRDKQVNPAFLDEVTTSVNEAMRATTDPIQQAALYTNAIETYKFADSQSTNQGDGQVAMAMALLVTPEPAVPSPIVINPTASVMPSATLEAATTVPTLLPTSTPSPTNTSTIALATDLPTATLTQTEQPLVVLTTAAPSVTPSATNSATSSGSGLVTATAFPTFTPSNTPTPTLPTDTPTVTDVPSETAVIPTVMYPTVTPTLTYTFTPIGGNITIVPPTPVPPTSAAPTSGSSGATNVPPTSVPTDSPTLTPTATSEVLLPCPSITPTPTEQLVEGATITPSPTETLTEDGNNKPAQAPTSLACLTLTPTPTLQPTEQTLSQ